MGSRMSSRRLWIRISKCSRESLSLNGPRTTVHAVLLGRQGNRASDGGAGAHDRLDDLLRRLVDDLVVVGLQPDTDLLVCSHVRLVRCGWGPSPSGNSDPCQRTSAPCGPAVQHSERPVRSQKTPIPGPRPSPERTPGPGMSVVDRDHFRILVTRPAPTVRPPSRMAKRRPSSMAIGCDELDGHLGVVAGHAHLGALGQRRWCR